jgi:Phasin protein
MADTRRMDEEASRIAHEVQEKTQRMGREYQKAVEHGFETASRSFSEANRGFQALAAEMTEFSKRRWEDVFRAWEQLLRARHFGDVVVKLQIVERARALIVDKSHWCRD